MATNDLQCPRCKHTEHLAAWYARHLRMFCCPVCHERFTKDQFEKFPEVMTAKAKLDVSVICPACNNGHVLFREKNGVLACHAMKLAWQAPVIELELADYKSQPEKEDAETTEEKKRLRIIEEKLGIREEFDCSK